MKITNDMNTFDQFSLSKNINDVKKTAGFAEKLGKAKDHREKLIKTAKEFESIIINLMLKSMRKTISKNKLFNGGMGEEVFQGMLDEQYSKNISKTSGFGLADILVKQLDKGPKSTK